MSEVRGKSGAKEAPRPRDETTGRKARAAIDGLLKRTELGDRGTESSERYQVEAEGADYRLGIVVDELTGRWSIELLLCVLREDAPLNIAVLARATRIAEAIRRRGYALAHQGDGWISCDKSISRKKAALECRTILGLLAEHGFGRSSAITQRAEEDNVNKEV